MLKKADDAYTAGKLAAMQARGVQPGMMGVMRLGATAKKFAPVAGAGAGLLAGAASAGEDDNSTLRGVAGAGLGAGAAALAMHRKSPLRTWGR